MQTLPERAPSALAGVRTRISSGFTLIELLVVIAIIALLSAVVLASLGTTRAKGRDARRLSDIKQIQLALELYYDACSTYPTNIYATGSGCTGGIAPDYISVVPTDPTESVSPSTCASSPATLGCYAYVALVGNATGGLCGSYHLGVNLETSQGASSQDAGGCPGGTFGDACSTTGGTYDGTLCSGSSWAGNTDFPQTGGDFTGSRTSPGIYDVRP